MIKPNKKLCVGGYWDRVEKLTDHIQQLGQYALIIGNGDNYGS